MSSISGNIDRICKILQGGINKVYLFPYVKYSRSQIVLDNQYLDSFPTTTVYEWDSINPNFNETTEVVGGDIAWNQTLTFEIPKTHVASEVYKLSKQYHRAIYIDRIGNIRILGLYNGLDAQITQETGTDKASLNGHRITLTGREDNQSYYLNNLNDFPPPDDVDNYIFQDGNNYIFEDGNNFIFNN